jgi:VWFA-related protein
MRLRPSFALFILAGLSLLAFPGAHSQNPPADSTTPALRTSSNLVLVDVVVTDHDKPVHGLDRSRFHILEDGTEQTISSFDEHQPAAAPPAFLAPAALPPNTYTNLPAYPDSPAVNVLLLDALNTPTGDQMRVRSKMIDYLATLKPGTELAIFTLSTQLRIVTQFTSDPAALVSLLKKSKANPQQQPLLDAPASAALDNNQVNAVAGATSTLEPPTPPSISTSGSQIGPMTALNALQQFQADQIAGQTNARIRITLDAMKQLAGYLSGIQGRKNVIWFSGSFPLTLLPEGGQFDAFANVETFREQVQQTADLLTAARVAIYPIDASGLWQPAEFSASDTTPIPSDIHEASQAQSTQWSQERERHYANQGSMQQLADETGGEPFFETNDFGKAVAGAIENGSSYYTLAYVPKNTAPDARPHNPAAQYRKIQVRLDQGPDLDHGLKLAYRRGYYADAPGKSSPSGSYTSTSDLSGGSSVFAAALAPDAPAATAILLRARVLPATDPAFQEQNLVGLSAGPPRPAAPATPTSPAPRPAEDKSASPNHPTRRYIVDLTIDAHTLALDNQPDGSRKAAIELAIIAYDGLGHPLNSYTHAYQVGLSAAQFQRIMASGISVRLPFDMPAGDIDLRIGVHDLNADRAGSLDIPLSIPSN